MFKFYRLVLRDRFLIQSASPTASMGLLIMFTALDLNSDFVCSWHCILMYGIILFNVLEGHTLRYYVSKPIRSLKRRH